MNEALYVGAGLDVQPIIKNKNIKIFHYIDGQPNSEFGIDEYILENGKNAFSRPNFISNLNKQMNKNNIKLININNNNNIRTYSNGFQTIYYYTNTSIPEHFNKISKYIQNIDTLIIIGYDPSSIILNNINKQLTFIGNSDTFYGNSEYEIENSIIYNLHNNNLKNKFTSFNLMNNDSIFTFNTWKEFYKQSQL